MMGYAHSRHSFVPKLFLLSGYRPMSIRLGSCLLDDAHVLQEFFILFPILFQMLFIILAVNVKW